MIWIDKTSGQEVGNETPGVRFSVEGGQAIAHGNKYHLID